MWRLVAAGVVVAGVVVAGGCRFSFEPHDGGGPPADALIVVDDSAFTPTTDAPATSVTTRFGECANADVTGVTADTTLDSSSPTYNIGKRTTMRVGNGKVSLLRYDLSSIPASAQIFSATLEISVSTTDALEQGDAVAYVVNESWIEGVENYQVGVCNWTQRNAADNWSVAGAGAPASRGTAIIGTFTPRVPGARHIVGIDPAAIQAWVSGSVPNYGMELAGLNEGMSGGWLVTSNEPDATTRPCLVVTYIP